MDSVCMDDVLGKDGLSATCPPKLLSQLLEQRRAPAEPASSRPPQRAGVSVGPAVEKHGGAATTAGARDLPECRGAPLPPQVGAAGGDSESPRHRERLLPVQDVDLEDLQVGIPCTLLQSFI